MKNIALISVFCLSLVWLNSCHYDQEISSIKPVNWEKRSINYELTDSNMHSASSYLSVYSQIYSQSEHKKLNLTATVSIRNVNADDSVFIHSAKYFDTHGKLIRSYFKETIFIRPMETVEIVIDQLDMEGGTGANFIFDWARKEALNDPHFEAVMISSIGQQGLSFTTQGIKLN